MFWSMTEKKDLNQWLTTFFVLWTGLSLALFCRMSFRWFYVKR